MTDRPHLEVQDLSVRFQIPQGFLRKPKTVRAVDGVSFAVQTGETLSIVGESGSGKSTLARAILRLLKPSGGQMRLGETNLMALNADEMRRARARMQMVFQDPVSSLSPRRTVQQNIEEPLLVHQPGLGPDQRLERVEAIMALMGLRSNMRNRYPHEFSGGQAQRIGIARALILEPELLIADEPVSALDVSIQAQVLNLIADIKVARDFTLVFISHDLSVVRHVSDKLLVLYLGQIMEMGASETIYANPKHPYTQTLLAAVPTLQRRDRTAAPARGGEIPSATDAIAGCPFAARCPLATDRCRHERPQLRSLAGRELACHEAT